MNTIYTAPQYTITVDGDVATLSNGTKSQKIPLRHGVDKIPTGYITALKKAGQNPADYFSVGGNSVLRRAALPAWTAAVDARIAERHAERAAKDAALAADIAVRGQRALVLHGAYLLSSALVYVRPMDAAEVERYAPEYRNSAFCPMGEWTSLDSEVVKKFIHGRRKSGHFPHMESVVFLVSEEEWNALESGNIAALEAKKAKKAEKAAAEAARIETARQQAQETGNPVEVDRIMDECDGSVSECSFDLVRRMIRPDGTRFTLRTHCH